MAGAGTSKKLSLSVVQKEIPESGPSLPGGHGGSYSEFPAGHAAGEQKRWLHSVSRQSPPHSFEGAGTARLHAHGNPREKSAFSVRQNFTLSADEGVYGLGQQQLGVMNYRGHAVKIVQANKWAVTPVLVSTAGYGLFWDNYSKTIFDDTGRQTSFWSEVGDNIDYYFFYGPSIDQEIAGYRQLTGQAPLYGKWAYGYWQSKEHYATRDELLGIAREYRTSAFPSITSSRTGITGAITITGAE